MIEWQRIAEPQSDGYDVFMALSFIPTLPRRGQYFDGAITIAPLAEPIDSGVINAPLDHPNIAEAERLLALWPAGYQSFRRLMYLFHPLDRDDMRGRGSTCGSDESKPGTMYATVYSAPGLAEAFVHEMGHTKLRYLGVKLESAERLITNAPDELFESPLRKDKLRPMTAVAHAVYSYCYVTALDLVMYNAGEDLDGNLQAIEVNYQRLCEGEAVMRAGLTTDADGERFFSGYFAWLSRILNECRAVLQCD